MELSLNLVITGLLICVFVIVSLLGEPAHLYGFSVCVYLCPQIAILLPAKSILQHGHRHLSSNARVPSSAGHGLTGNPDVSFSTGELEACTRPRSTTFTHPPGSLRNEAMRCLK